MKPRFEWNVIYKFNLIFSFVSISLQQDWSELGKFLLSFKLLSTLKLCLKNNTLTTVSFFFAGVGRATRYKLEHLHVKTCGDLQELSLSTLQQHFGLKTGQILYNYCRGKDDRSLQMEYNQKSVSAEINYGIRFKNVSLFPQFVLIFTHHLKL